MGSMSGKLWRTKLLIFSFFQVVLTLPFQFFIVTFESLNLCVNNYFQSEQNRQSTQNDSINTGIII